MIIEREVPFCDDKNIVEIEMDNRTFLIRKKGNGYINLGDTSEDDIFYDMSDILD